MDLLFLDANVLFSAAWKEDARVRRLWELSDVELLTSAHAAGEADRNLVESNRRHRFGRLMGSVRLIPEARSTAAARGALPANRSLPEGDLSVLASAIESGASHLLTGDFRHFGALYGRTIGGVRVLSPAAYLRES